MKRRDFVTVVGMAAVWPLSARAQQAAIPRVGYVSVNVRRRTSGESPLTNCRILVTVGTPVSRAAAASVGRFRRNRSGIAD
jgi:hypothetical protein